MKNKLNQNINSENVQNETAKDNLINAQNEVIKNLKEQLKQNQRDTKIVELNETIKTLQDESIKKEQKINELKHPSTKGFITCQIKKAFTKNDIENYEKESKKISELIASKHGNNYILNITKYKTWSDKHMEFLDELKIEKNIKTNKYKLTPTQLDALVEKILVYRYNVCL